ncbi:MAG: winged helix-turn-helix domain-containing protein [Xanthomonadaceae bacterium]|nr:winged helix-turn-helix domain-containing protein [Xanthomonadaceae bacterium]
MERHEYAEQTVVLGTFAFADVIVDAGAHRLSRAGHDIAVEPKAFAVLLQFLTHPDQLLARDQLLDAVWGHSFVTPATLNRIIAQLRRALADDSETPRCIQTVHGLGYRFIAELEQVPEKTVPALRFAPPARARLPERAEPLIGRERDIEELRRLLHESRLVTVVGPGGIGKTQAALETARSVAADFSDSVWLFDCTPQTDEHGLARMLTTTFEIRTATDAEDLVTRLSELLRARCALLVFDNCERVAGQLGQVLASLLAACATLRALVTSQRRLHCVGESLFPLPPLELPPEGEWTSDEQVANLAHVPAVQLLLTRSRAFASGFALTLANAARVAELCRRLAGLPLALELAAARLRLLSPEQLLTRMDARLLNLADADSDRPQHHQNLRALIEWSFALLSEREQSLLCGISIFAGACTLGGAIDIGVAFGLDESQTLDLLAGLMDKSLLNMDGATNPPSYRLLDSVRLFALERLVAGNSETCARRAHLMHFVKLTERFNAEVLGERNRLWHERIKREWANLHSAFDFAVTQPDLADSALALVGNLFWYFRASTDYAQSAQWLEQALRVGQSPTRHRARALIAAGMSMYHAVEQERAELRLREGIALATQLGEPWLATAGQAILALQLVTSGDFAGVETCVQAVLASAEAQQDDWLRSIALLSRGIALALHDRHREAEASISAAFECLSLHGDFFQRTYTLVNRALQRFHLGDLRRAAQDWLSDLDICTGFQQRRGAAGCVEGAAYIAAERDEFEKAARFLAAAARVRELTGAPLMPQWRKAQHVAERKAREAMGAEFQHAQQAGTSARFEKIALEARALLVEIAAAQPVRTGASNPSGS